LISACCSTLLAASFGSLGLLASNQISSTELWPTWSAWWLGDGMGILVISPVLLTLFGRIKSNNLKASRLKILEALVLAVLLGIIGEMIFNSAKLTGLGFFPVSLSMFPFAIWSALRFGTIGASGVALIASMVAINGTMNGTGPFAVSSRMDSLILWCLYADIMAVTGLILSAVDTARQNAVEALKLNNQSLEKLVQTRTAELIQTNKDLQSALAERRHLQLEMNHISEERQKMIGQELHDGLGQLLTGISFLVSSLNETLQAKLAPEASGMQQIKSLLLDAVATVRALSRGLYPVEMESQGFKAALKQLAYFTQKSSGAHCKVNYPHHAFVIDKAIALNLYRIAQEAINNALRHGKADWIEINLLADKDHYMFTIDDDGSGFPYKKVDSRLSIGLRSIHSRAELIGAVIEVREKLGGGTSIIVTGSNQY
jgi:signal transduction histidine kinase